MQLAELQTACETWFNTAFAEYSHRDEIAAPVERATRHFEEVVELCQVHSIPVEKLVHVLLHVYSKPVEPNIDVEIGGSILTLALVCWANGRSLHDATVAELARAHTLIPTMAARADRKRATGTSVDASRISPELVVWCKQIVAEAA